MSKIKNWILRKQEIDPQDDPDMEGPGDGEFADENERLEGFHAGDAGARYSVSEGEVKPK